MTIMNQWQNKGSFIPFDRPVETIPSSDITTGDKLSVCFNKDWLPLVLGALKPLCRYETYKGTAEEVSFAVSQGMELLASISECGDMLQFRTVNLCTIEYSLDGGVSWNEVADLSACLSGKITDGVVSPGTGVYNDTLPPVYSCQEYSFNFSANEYYVLPFNVNTGDTVQVTSAVGTVSGAMFSTDETYNVQGKKLPFPYVTPGSDEPSHTGDPRPASNHMRLLIYIKDTYYDALGGIITVPSGVSNSPVVMLVNDSVVQDNAGLIFVDVTACSGQWCRAWLNTKGNTTTPAWIPVTNFGQIALYDSTNDLFYSENVSTDPLVWRTIQLNLDLHLLSGFTVTKVVVDCESVYPSDATEGSTSHSTIVIDGSEVAHHDQSGSYTGTDTFTMDTGNISKPDCDLITIYTESRKNQHVSASGSAKVKSIVIYGTATNPFTSSNC